MAEKTVKKAVIATGGKQYLVSEGQTLEVDLLGGDKTA
jgi:ribosomal protein L21